MVLEPFANKEADVTEHIEEANDRLVAIHILDRSIQSLVCSLLDLELNRSCGSCLLIDRRDSVDGVTV